MLISQTVLVAGERFSEQLTAERVVRAIARGLEHSGSRRADVCPIERDHDSRGARARAAAREPRELLERLGVEARMLRARAVAIAVARLSEQTLAGSVAFELASRARQTGVPAYAIASESTLSLFDARMLDLQVILTARDARGLAAAGRELARIV